jgi:IS30 family transposase
MSSKHCYSHLTPADRDRLALYRAQGKSLRFIAAQLRRSPSTISRELRRNCAPIHKAYYCPHPAQARANVRKSAASRHKRLRDPLVLRYVESKLLLRWSPELISGRLPLDIPGKRISHEAIYQWIYADAYQLARFLPKSHRKRRYRGYVKRKHLRQHIPDRVPIADRPSSVLARRVAGHWEADTAGNRQSSAVLLVLHERKTRFTILRKLRRRTSAEFSRNAIETLQVLPKTLRRSITYDNGPENALHTRINHRLGTHSFFCAPYHSWEKGSVENAIGLLRLFCPKSRHLSRVSHAQVAAMQHALNHRPRKCLRYQTPAALLACELRRADVAPRRRRAILQLSGETDAGSAGEQPAKG